MIPNKYIAIGIGLVILYFLYSQFTGLIEDNAKQETEISNLRTSSDLLAKDSVRKSKINVERNEKISDLEKSKKVLQDDLKKLKTTPQQAKCDVTPTPSGYADRLLKREYQSDQAIP